MCRKYLNGLKKSSSIFLSYRKKWRMKAKKFTKTFLFFCHLLVSCSLDLFAFILFDISSFYNGLIIANVPKAMFSCLTQQPTCISKLKGGGIGQDRTRHTCVLTCREMTMDNHWSERWSEMESLCEIFTVLFQ